MVDLLPACRKYEQPVKKEEQLVPKDWQGWFISTIILTSRALSTPMKIIECLKQDWMVWNFPENCWICEMGSIWPNISGSPERKHIWHGNSQEEILGKFEYMYLVRLSSFSKIVVLFTDGNFWKLKLFFFCFGWMESNPRLGPCERYDKKAEIMWNF